MCFQVSSKLLDLITHLQHRTALALCRPYLAKHRTPQSLKQFTPVFEEHFVPNQPKSEVKRLKRKLKDDTKVCPVCVWIFPNYLDLFQRIIEFGNSRDLVEPFMEGVGMGSD